MKIAVITGASSGLGREFVRQIDRKEPEIEEIWAIARRKDRLEELRNLTSLPVRVISLDLLKENSFERLRQMLEKETPEIGILICAAGFGKIGDYQEVSREDSDRMILLNCKAAVDMTQIALPYMKRGDRILEICSTAGFQPFPYLNVYAATKAFLYRYARALGSELLPRGIHVTAVCPYWIKDTEFIGGARSTERKIRIRHFVLASKVESVAGWALKDSRTGLPVSTPGIVCTIHRAVAKVFPSYLMMGIWEGIRRL